MWAQQLCIQLTVSEPQGLGRHLLGSSIVYGWAWTTRHLANAGEAVAWTTRHMTHAGEAVAWITGRMANAWEWIFCIFLIDTDYRSMTGLFAWISRTCKLQMSRTRCIYLLNQGFYKYVCEICISHKTIHDVPNISQHITRHRKLYFRALGWKTLPQCSVNLSLGYYFCWKILTHLSVTT